MIERIHLAILREIERRGSLTAAAESLNLTQSALSHSIKKLESQLGLSLWRKKGRGLHLTDAGNCLLSAARRILPQLEHTDELLRQFASGDRARLRIGMECHPCYQWLLKVVRPCLQQWPDVDIDVRQAFQFGGIAALFNHEIDLLVTPDPLHKPGLVFIPVFDYEQVLAVAADHPLAGKACASPADLVDQRLYTYPVEHARLDIYTRFLVPAQCSPKQTISIEATEIMLQLVASGRGVAALPGWLVEEYSQQLPLKALRLGKQGIRKTIHLAVREGEQRYRHIAAFLSLAATVNDASPE